MESNIKGEQFGLERCQEPFVLIQIPACMEIFLIAAGAPLLRVRKIKSFAREQGLATTVSSGWMEMVWVSL